MKNLTQFKNMLRDSRSLETGTLKSLPYNSDIVFDLSFNRTVTVIAVNYQNHALKGESQPIPIFDDDDYFVFWTSPSSIFDVGFSFVMVFQTDEDLNQWVGFASKVHQEGSKIHSFIRDYIQMKAQVEEL